MNSLALNRPIICRYPWMFGRQFDLCFFFIPFFLGLLFFALTRPFVSSAGIVLLILINNAFGLGPFHLGPTLFAYLDKQNQAHWQKDPVKQAIFFLGPILVFTLSVLGAVKYPALLLIAWIVWSVQHLVQQNVGILLLYHNYKSKETIVNRHLEITSQQLAAVCFTLIFCRRWLPSLGTMTIFDSLIWLTAAVTICLIVAYLVQTWRQIGEGKALNVPAFAFWWLSLACLYPLAFWGKDFASGFLAPLIWHWSQYIGLNWRLVKNKYTAERLNNLPIPKPVSLLLSISSLTVLITLALLILAKQSCIENVFYRNILLGLGLGMSFSHYFIDAFLWRFRESYQRETVLPYLKTAPVGYSD